MRIAETLAQAKAAAVSEAQPHALVIGADQVLAFDNQVFGKAKDVHEARAHLRQLRGHTAPAAQAVALAEAGEILWSHAETAHLAMRAFSDAFLDRYLAEMGPRVCQTVGAYEIEGRGIQLFERIEGDTFTIIGLPLLAAAWPSCGRAERSTHDEASRARVHHRLAGRPLALADDPWLLAEEVSDRRQLRASGQSVPARSRHSCTACASMGLPAAMSRYPTRRRPTPQRRVTMPAARAVGAANTLWFEDGRLVADNTDAAGFMSHLRACAPRFDARRSPVAVLGAGGAARGIVHAFLEAGAPEVHLFNRTRERADAVARPFRRARQDLRLADRVERSREAGVLVNATSLGMEHVAALDMPLAQLDAGCVVADLVYVPLRHAAAGGSRARAASRPSTASACCCTRRCRASRNGSACAPRSPTSCARLLVADIEGH